MEEESLLDEECLALESIFENRFTRLQPDRIRLIVISESSEDSSAGQALSCWKLCLQQVSQAPLHCRHLLFRAEHEFLTLPLGAAGSVPLFLELVIPADYPNVAPQPDLSNVNNAPYMPAVKDQAVSQLIAEVSKAGRPCNIACSSIISGTTQGVLVSHCTRHICLYCLLCKLA